MDLKKYIESERGRAAKLASALGVSPSYLSQMIAGTSPISPERCVAIEVATNGLVTRKDLRKRDWKKIWPELDPKNRLKSTAAICDAAKDCATDQKDKSHKRRASDRKPQS